MLSGPYSSSMPHHTMLPYQVQKAQPSGNWEPVARFALLHVAEEYVRQHADAHKEQNEVLRIFCEPRDVARAIRAAMLEGILTGDSVTGMYRAKP